jgi:hypothetical protein
VPGDQGKPPRARRSKSTRAEPAEPPDHRDGYGPPGDDESEAVDAHAEFVARHFGGGVEATPELLDRAIVVWQRFPGAVVRGPALIRPNRPAGPVGDGEDVTS